MEVIDGGTIFRAVVFKSQVYKDLPGPWVLPTLHIIGYLLSYEYALYLPNLISLHSLLSQPVHHLYKFVSITLSVPMPDFQLPT